MNLSHSLSHMFPIRVGHSRHFCMRLEDWKKNSINIEFDICRLQGRDLSPTHSVALLTYLADMEQQLCPRGLCLSLSPFKSLTPGSDDEVGLLLLQFTLQKTEENGSWREFHFVQELSLVDSTVPHFMSLFPSQLLICGLETPP